MGSAAATGNVGDILSWDAMYSLSGMRPRTDSKTARWSLVPGDLPLQTDEDSRARARHRLHSILAGAAATPTPNTSLALRGAYSLDGRRVPEQHRVRLHECGGQHGRRARPAACWST